MKTKTLCLIIFILCGMVNVSVSLQANVEPGVVIKDIEYLTGEDFVQLYFKIQQLIPIPDVFYPDKNDNTRIVMRMNGVSFEPKKEQYKFDSSVIDGIKISRNAAENDLDIEIQLKEQVNYRVFTNQKGLYIEFPNIKHIETSSPASPTPSSAASSTAVASAAPSPRVVPEETESRDEASGSEDTSANPGVANWIKDIVVSEKDSGRIKFKILLNGSDSPDYEVIPIHREPARLAIDFKHTGAKQMKKAINLLNVKQVRGAYNSPDVFRVVFDLEYLKKYNISPSVKGNGVEVEFFNEDVALAQNTQAMPSEPSKPIDVEVKEKGVVMSNTPDIPKNINVGVQGGQGEEPTALPSQDENGGTQQPPMVISNVEESGNDINEEITISHKPGEGTTVTNVRKNDFFEDEKSRVSPQEFRDSAEETGSGSTGTSLFSRQTIDGGQQQYKGEPVTFNFHNADLKDVIKIIAKLSDLNIVMDPGVNGRITSQLNQVPWDQALALFLKINGLDMVQEGNIVRIGKVSDLEAEANNLRKLREAKQMEGDLTVFTRTLSFAKVGEVIPILKKQLSKRGEIIEDNRSNTLIISEVPTRIDIIDKLIDTLDTPNPQVSIEARIVETNANYIESFGIQWGYNFIADAAYGNQTTLKFPNSIGVSGTQFRSQSSPLVGPLGGYAVNLPATGAQSGTMFTLGNVANTFRLDVALSAMQSKGEGRIISAPKTTTQNNMEASIMQGKQIPVQTIQNNTVTVQYRPAALELKVTPQITAEGTIITALEINNNSADFGNLVNGIPPITTQSIKTTVMVTDGGTIVIGGMYRVEKSETREGVPFFSKIPLLGSLFRNRSNRSEQKELLVFITPRIIK